jgi:exoribonuclease R
MLLTNIAVAQQIAVALPEQALLRRHDAPIERRLVRPIGISYIHQTNETSIEFPGREGRTPWVQT